MPVEMAKFIIAYLNNHNSQTEQTEMDDWKH
jgi:hypothetical protein